jgi:hypothetical protein
MSLYTLQVIFRGTFGLITMVISVCLLQAGDEKESD